MNYLKRERKFFYIAIAIIFVWVLPYFVLNEDAHMRVHDNLDSNLGWYEVMKDNGIAFSPLHTPVEQIMNGEFSRDTYYSEYYAMVFLFQFLPPVIAYGLCQAITHFVAFIGMYLLLKKYVMKEEHNKAYILTIGVALAFSLTPYWPSGMLSILGMPLALWSMLNIYKGERSWKDLAVLTLLPFFSTFVIGFFYFLAVMGLFWLYDFVRNKKSNWALFFAILYMTMVYLAIDYRLVASMIAPISDELTNRDVFYQSKLDFVQTLKLVGKNYVISHNQDRTIHQYIILPVTIIGLLFVLLKKQWRENKLYIGLHLLNIVLSTWYAFWFFEGWQPLKEKFGILTSFNFARFHYLRPMIIYVLFALTLKMLWKNRNMGRKLVYVLIIGQLLVLVPTNEQIMYKNQPSYKAYFATDQFTDIKKYIGKPLDQYRVVSIGIHPNIAQYNGLYTLDSYSNIYPLDYKLQFRKIIEPELDKNKALRTYYDDWGGRCYIFVDELGKNYQYSKRSNKEINHLQLNVEALKEMGGQYVLSAVPINNAAETNLTFMKDFESKNSNWHIYLYKVM
ncbi:hypothetical protein C2I06_13775 [Niallia circulans]|uniref:Uncharacterized protein n=1 Tax=Niallia circulans TaxID=1397 RepID=A0A268FCK0_NIACI|nr:DUF6044 family protein [Niallia circulans]AYV67851.1 hypothetical protein C2I06_13775 [Niallia circulans]AYV73798.1 hypothetical protein C2H98_20765 [Niallia circulans]PAD83105.1 hypothetical protein CHH57_11190 [Niallia circulans]